MHIQLNEALALLDRWKNEATRIRMRASGPAGSQELLCTIRAVTGSTVGIGDDVKSLEIDLTGADLNGDPAHAEYLVCEFSDGRRYAFHVARGAAVVPSAERLL
jgi:hypothetical protein